jgi:CubicO group peptidase (beta-lactamase class C family)
MRRRLAIGLGVLLLVLLACYGSAHLLTSRYAWARAVAWLESDTGDQFRFPDREIAAGDEASPLPRGETPEALRTPVNAGGVGRPLATFLAGTDTTAFLVVHDDRLVYERYLNGADRDDRQTSFSAAKSFASTLVGIAVDEGHIDSVTDPITDYLPELAERDQRFTRITVRHLLTMSSGIAYTEQGLPWSDDALTYYGTDLRDLALTHTHVEERPGHTWRYNNFHPLLLGLILERATRMSVSEYMATRLWQPLGAEADASWSLDSRRSRFEKMESGINARPVDYARFGLMMLHQGRWNGRQVVSADWVKEATAVSHASDPAEFYQYLWWVGTPRPGEQRPPFFAHGKYGLLVGVFPEDDVVIVRLGASDGGVDWQTRLREIADRVAAEQP